MTTTSRDETQIRELLAEQATAIRERDAKGLISRFAPEMVSFSLAPPLRADAHDVAARQAWFATFDGPIDYELRDVEVSVGGDVAFCHGLARLSATPNGAPQGFDLWFRVTVGLRKIDGTWTITHQHESTPFYMDGSFKAAVDLRP